MDWIYPPQCAGCGKPGYRFCPDCEVSISYLKSNLCLTCGQPLLGRSSNHCMSCLENPPAFQSIRSVAIYEKSIREALLKMKFHQDFGISEYFGFKLADLISTLNWNFDLIIPIPLSKQRRKFRGFNQSYRLALPIGLTFSKPIYESGLIRSINTQTQADLPREQRMYNVQGAFIANQDVVQGKRILLVDDIATTSATMNGCSTELLAKQAAAVMGVTVARAVL
jgi:ComF family protein